MTGLVYFAQPREGGPIKIGTSTDAPSRVICLNAYWPTGVEILATIPGGATREAAVHWLLEPWRRQGEWFAGCPVVWRVVLDALDHGGELPWLPAEEKYRGDQGKHLSEIRAYFGSKEKAHSALGYATTTWFGDGGKILGRYWAHRLIVEGAAPKYIIDAYSALQSDAA